MQMRILSATGVLCLAMTACAATPAARSSGDVQDRVPTHAPAYDPAAQSGALFDTVDALDRGFFEGFNQCADAGQLQRHIEQIDPALEFYHDKGGADFSRDKYVSDLKANVCGKFERQRVPGTLRVYPIPGFGAIALGVHVFCPFASARCEGAGDFLMVWKQDGERWRLTRAISYAHRAVVPGAR